MVSLAGGIFYPVLLCPKRRAYEKEGQITPVPFPRSLHFC